MGICSLIQTFFANDRQDTRRKLQKLPPHPNNGLTIATPASKRSRTCFLGSIFARQVTPIKDSNDLNKETVRNLKLNGSQISIIAHELTVVNDSNASTVNEENSPTISDADSFTNHNDNDDAVSPDDESESGPDDGPQGNHTTNESEWDEDAERWGQIRSIPDQSLINLLHRVLDRNNKKPEISWQTSKRTEGGYHHVAFMSNGCNKVVVKIPVVGTEDRWRPGHVAIMRSEAHTMTYIKQKLPTFPIPDVLAYDETFENEIGAPFVILSFMEGKPSYELWYEKTGDGRMDLMAADFPSEERDKIRTTFLESLAKTMSDLRQLEFDAAGMMTYENGDQNKPKIGPFHGWDEREDESKREYYERPVYTTAAEYFTDRLNMKFCKTDDERLQGKRFVLDSLFNSSPICSSKKNDGDDKESFTFLHNDLDLQNILVSDSGEVTAILDWDGAATVPRCMGFSTVPLFLQEDWRARYVLPATYVLSPWRLIKYRKVYAQALMEACGGPDTDAKYTELSGMYGALHDVMFGDNGAFYENTDDFVQKLLLEIPLLRRVAVDDFYDEIRGWEEAKQVLLEWIPKVLDFRNV